MPYTSYLMPYTLYLIPYTPFFQWFCKVSSLPGDKSPSAVGPPYSHRRRLPGMVFTVLGDTYPQKRLVRCPSEIKCDKVSPSETK